MSGDERWRVHVEFTDGQTDEAIGRPDVVGDNLQVTVQAADGSGLLFEACYPLRHVRVWWCDYQHDGAPRKATGRQRVNEPQDSS